MQRYTPYWLILASLTALNTRNMNILERANKIVNERSEEKERQYGPFAESMERAANIYNAISPDDEQIKVEGMYRAMIALKLSRETYAHKEDNLLDAVAYMGAMNDYIENGKNSPIPSSNIAQLLVDKLCENCKLNSCETCNQAAAAFFVQLRKRNTK